MERASDLHGHKMLCLDRFLAPPAASLCYNKWIPWALLRYEIRV